MCLCVCEVQWQYKRPEKRELLDSYAVCNSREGVEIFIKRKEGKCLVNCFASLTWEADVKFICFHFSVYKTAASAFYAFNEMHNDFTIREGVVTREKYSRSKLTDFNL